MTTFCDHELKIIDDKTKSNIFFDRLKNSYIEYYAVSATDTKKFSMIDKFHGEKLSYPGAHLQKLQNEPSFALVTCATLESAYLTNSIEIVKELKKNLDKVFEGKEVYFCVMKILTVSEPVYDN